VRRRERIGRKVALETVDRIRARLELSPPDDERREDRMGAFDLLELEPLKPAVGQYAATGPHDGSEANAGPNSTRRARCTAPPRRRRTRDRAGFGAWDARSLGRDRLLRRLRPPWPLAAETFIWDADFPAVEFTVEQAYGSRLVFFEEYVEGLSPPGETGQVCNPVGFLSQSRAVSTRVSGIRRALPVVRRPATLVKVAISSPLRVRPRARTQR
jgi:hypothetical protein